MILIYNEYWSSGDYKLQKDFFWKFTKAYTNGSKSMERKISFAAIFTDITRRGVLSEKGFIHTAEVTVIKVAFKKIHKNKDKKLAMLCI